MLHYINYSNAAYSNNNIVIINNAVLWYVGQAMEEDVVRAVFLPRPGAGATQVRTSWLEHSVRVQRVGPPHQHAPDAGESTVAIFHEKNQNWELENDHGKSRISFKNQRMSRKSQGIFVVLENHPNINSNNLGVDEVVSF